MSITHAGVKARALAYAVRGARTVAAVERLEKRYADRAASARYVSDAMITLKVDEETTTAYREVGTLSEDMAADVAGIVDRAQQLSQTGEQLHEHAEAEHGLMADLNRTHSVQMADRRFIKRT